MNRHQKGKINLDFTETRDRVSGSSINWAICKSAPRSRQITMLAPHCSVLYRSDASPAAQPSASKHCFVYRTSGHINDDTVPHCCRRADLLRCSTGGANVDPSIRLRGSLHPSESAHQTATRSVQSFLQGSPVCPTHSDRATSVAIARLTSGEVVTVGLLNCG